MKKVFAKLKKDKVPFFAFCVLFALYFLILFADFFALYPSSYSNRKMAYQPPNNIYIITPENKLSKPYTYNYIKSFNKDSFSIEYKQDRSKKYYIKLFSKGFEYKLFGLFKSNIHFLSVDKECREFVTRGSELRGRKNELSKQIGILFKNKEYLT